MLVASSSLGYATSGRPRAVSGSPTSQAMEKLVPGDYPQVEQDLAAFPQPTLDLLSRYGVRVAILESGKTLADSPGLRTLSAEENLQEAYKANSIAGQAISEAFVGGMESYSQLEDAADEITRELRQQGLDHQLAIALSPFQLDELAGTQNILADQFEDWKSSFAVLNRGLTEITPDGLQATQGLIVLPHTYRDGEAVPSIRLRNAKEVTAEYVEGSLGLNRSDERMVLLHEKFLGQPATEVGNYRLATHEVGHALDYALENLTSIPGFGQTHRETVDALYAADQARLVALGPSAKTEDVFTSDRADDDVREYFAEAVEAYLTPSRNDAYEIFRAGNSHEGLATKNPALFAYVESVFTTEFPESAVPNSPKRQLVPPGVPDPDLEVIRIS